MKLLHFRSVPFHARPVKRCVRVCQQQLLFADAPTTGGFPSTVQVSFCHRRAYLVTAAHNCVKFIRPQWLELNASKALLYSRVSIEKI